MKKNIWVRVGKVLIIIKLWFNFSVVDQWMHSLISPAEMFIKWWIHLVSCVFYETHSGGGGVEGLESS